jgi:hypothetical protein
MNKKTTFSNPRWYFAVFLMSCLIGSHISFAQKWPILNTANQIANNAAAPSGNVYNKIAVALEGANYVPYATYAEGSPLKAKVKKRNTDGSWSALPNLLWGTGTGSIYPNLAVDANNTLYACFMDQSATNKLAVVKYDGSGWVALDGTTTTNPYVSSNTALGFSAGTGLKSSPRANIAFDASNAPYVAYNEAGACVVKKYTGSAWEQLGNIITVTGSGNTMIGAQKVIIDESNTPWVMCLNAASSGASGGTLSFYKYNTGTNTFDSITFATTAATYRDFDLTLVRGTGTTNSGKIAVCVNNGGGLTSYLYDKNAASPSWSLSLSVSASGAYPSIASDSNGNLYSVFRDNNSTISGTNNNGTPTVKIFPNTQSTAWIELKNSGTYLETGVSTTSISTWHAIGIGNAPYPYIAYNLEVLTSNGAAGDDMVRVLDPTTTWSGSAWSDGTPTSLLEAVINGNYSTISNGGGFTAKKLTVNATKSFTVNAGANVTVQDNVINNGALTVENNANLIQVNGFANTGNITVKRNSNPLSRLDYTMWSSPVSGTQTLAQFSPLTSQSPSRFYTYNPTLGTAGLYSAVAEPTSTVFAKGTAYLIRMPNTDPTSGYDAGTQSITYQGEFTGVPNNGNVSLTGLTAGKFYAIGNPYASTVSAASFLSGNATAGTTLYFWRKKNDATSTSYATWTTAGGVANSGDPNAIAPNGTIQVGQGFIVSSGTATSLNFTNVMREATPTSTQFLKIKPTAEKSRLWLNLTSPAGGINQMLVAYMDGASADIDDADGKYINDAPTALTSIINDEEYIIQGRALPFESTDVVSLAFKAKTAGQYTIAIDHTDGLFAKGQNVYLVDSVTGREINLSNEAYTFTAESGTANDRFTLKYESSSKTVGSSVFTDNTITVYKTNGTLYVNSAGRAFVNIKVFDVQGRLITEQKDLNATNAAIKNLKTTQQLLLIQVTSEDKKVVTKKVVNQ